jgi:hypothetical protein
VAAWNIPILVFLNDILNFTAFHGVDFPIKHQKCGHISILCYRVQYFFDWVRTGCSADCRKNRNTSIIQIFVSVGLGSVKMSVEKQQFVLPNHQPISYLDCDSSFAALSDQERFYLHFFSKVSIFYWILYWYHVLSQDLRSEKQYLLYNL